MAHSAIEPVASDLYGYLKQSRSLASAARQWLNPAFGPTKPKFSPTYRSTLIEVAFLRSFLAWESFLEESFLLYLLGKKPRKRRRPPKRYVTPRDREHALTLMLPEKGRDFVMWDNPDQVRVRAGRFLKDGEPFETAISAHLNVLKEMQVVRNAIAHRSLTSQQRFLTLARSRLGTASLGLTVGEYLDIPIPLSAPPLLQFDRYLAEIEATAQAIAT